MRKSKTGCIATHMLVFEGDSKVVWSEGNDNEADRKRRHGIDADTPH